jgi:hypothetical protein
MAAQFTSTNGPCRLFAGAVIAVNQNAAVGRRRHGHLVAQPPHRRTLAHHHMMPIDFRAQNAVLGLEIALPEGVAHHQDGLFERERLLDEVERPHLDRADG